MKVPPSNFKTLQSELDMGVTTSSTTAKVSRLRRIEKKVERQELGNTRTKVHQIWFLKVEKRSLVV